MELMYSEVEALFEGNLLEGESQMWGHEMSLFGEKVDQASTSYLPVAPQSKEEDVDKFQLNFNHDVSTSTVNTDESYLNIFEDLIEAFDMNEKDVSMGIKVDNIQVMPWVISCNKTLEPLSPAGSFDSGVASPGSVDSNISWSSENISLGLPGDSLLPETALSQDHDISEDFLNELGIELLPEKVQPAADILVPSISLENVSLNSFENVLSFPLETHTSELPVIIKTSQDALSQTVPVPQEPVAIQIPAKPQSGRKSKVTSTEEKKQRKRAQNKNAATRYRERKRQENDEREGEFNALNNKNKELQDKATQIAREIDYLKELMIEVYTIKGLIS